MEHIANLTTINNVHCTWFKRRQVRLCRHLSSMFPQTNSGDSTNAQTLLADYTIRSRSPRILMLLRKFTSLVYSLEHPFIAPKLRFLAVKDPRAFQQSIGDKQQSQKRFPGFHCASTKIRKLSSGQRITSTTFTFFSNPCYSICCCMLRCNCKGAFLCGYVPQLQDAPTATTQWEVLTIMGNHREFKQYRHADDGPQACSAPC
jgi:hypothetical protein